MMKKRTIELRRWMGMMTMMAILLCSCSVFSACGGDDDEESPTLPTQEKKLLGSWNEGNSFVLMTQGVMLYSGGKGRATWNYDETTKILGTSAVIERNNYNLQWKITMIGDNEWAGLALWLDEKPRRASRDAESGAILILTGFEWKPEGGGSTRKFTHRKVNNLSLLETEGSSSSGFYVNATESVAEDVIKIRDLDDVCEIHHPYDLKKLYLQYPSGQKYYPVY